jgi:hypothetical protein
MASERDRPPTPIRTSRRRFVRAVSATGALVASSYVKPNLHSLGVTGALAAVSGGGYQGGGNNQDGNSQGGNNQDGNSQGDNKGKGGK